MSQTDNIRDVVASASANHQLQAATNETISWASYLLSKDFLFGATKVILTVAVSAIAYIILTGKGKKIKKFLIDKVISNTIKKLTKPGGICELGKANIRGVEYRVFKNAPKSLHDWFELGRKYESDDFVVFTGKPGTPAERYTFKQSFDIAQNVRSGLANVFNIKKGDRVAILMSNIPEFVFSFMGIVDSGAIAVPLNAWWEGEEIEYGLLDSGSSVLICDEKRLMRLYPDGRLEKLMKEKGLKVIVANPSDEFMKHASKYVMDFKTFTAKGSEKVVPHDSTIEAEDIATIMYTSGTSSGRPKGVVLTHRSFIQTGSSYQLFTEMGISLTGKPKVRRADLLTTPLFHASSLSYNLILAFPYGHKVVLVPKWDVELAVKTCLEEKITYIGCMPTMLGDMLNSESFMKERSKFYFTNIGTGGAPCPTDLIKRMFKAMPKMTQGTGWGLTETNAIGTVIGGPDYVDFPQSCGKPHLIVDVKMVNPDTLEDIPQTPGATGELCIRSPTGMKEYWNMPEATKATILKDGWIRTGDVGKIDENGFYYIVDRVKDLVIRGGENISCNEVEDVIYQLHENIHEVCCFGLPHERLGEQLCAAVVLKPGKTITAEEVKAHCIQHLAKFKVPSLVFVRKSDQLLPRGGTAKVLKRALREEYKDFDVAKTT